ncbi:MAG TPA: ATP-dependent Clp protease proteolytic subunit [Xanthobacteraceae bacterium]|nr:ATP-dependent Clp protease proteolytic subunit [Xanthobacteraceae bacterium]
MDTFGWLILFFLIASTLQPLLQGRYQAMQRARQIAAIEKERGSRVITMIHRQETRSFFSVPVARMIDLEDAQQIIPAIQQTPADTPIDLILHTPGGMVLAAMQIARALNGHPSRVTVHVPVYAMSGGTLLALAADEIVLDSFSVLGPIDPQIIGVPAASLVEVKREKPIAEVNDLTLLLANMSEKALAQVKRGALELVGDKLPEEKAKRLVDALASGQWTHDYGLTATEAKSLGLNVTTGLAPSILALMQLYPQPVRHLPSIEFLPVTPSRQSGPKGMPAAS